MKKGVSIIFDQFGHPNQPFWYNLYNVLIDDGKIRIRAYSQEFHTKPKGEFHYLKSQTKLQYIKAILIYPFNYSKISTSFANYISMPFLAADSNNVVHILNAQQYPYFQNALSRKKLIFSFRGYETLVRPEKDIQWKKYLQTIYKNAHALHFVSEYIRDFAVDNFQAPKEKCIVIRRSVNTEFFDPGEKTYEITNKIQICSIGRLTWQKGFIYAIEALNVLKMEGYDFHYTIIGEGPDRAELEILIEKLKLSNKISLVGQKSREDIRSVLKRSDIYIQPSVNEALPNSILEASAMALPIITTNAGGIPEAVLNGTTGLILHTKNSDQIYEALKLLISSEEKRRKFGLEARNFMLQEYAPKMELHYWLKCYSA